MTDSNENRAPADKRLRALGLLQVALFSGAMVLCAYAGSSGMGTTALELPFAKQVNAILWMPQGWKFFTRDPREEVAFFFQRNDGGQWRSVSQAPNADPSHFFGWNRASRAQGVEFGNLAPSIPVAAYQDCDREPVECLREATGETPIENTSPLPTLCGSVGIVLQKPVPWAWARAVKHVTMPSRVVRVSVSCL